MVDQRRRPVGGRGRGYGAPLGTLIAGLLALIAFDLTHRPAAPAAPHASVRPTVTAHASPAGTAPTGRGAQPSAAGTQPPAADTGTSVGNPSGPGSPPTPSPPPPTPGPTPSPAPSPRSGLTVTAVVVAPLRGATPVAVRAALVAPAAPPFPDPILNIGLNLTLGGPVSITGLSHR